MKFNVNGEVVEFNVGEIVICKDTRGERCLTKGKKYEIVGIDADGFAEFFDDEGDLRFKSFNDYFIKDNDCFTREHDYTGCPTKIADMLMLGKEVFCKVYDHEDGTYFDAWVYGYVRNSNYPFLCYVIRNNTEQKEAFRLARVAERKFVTIMPASEAFRVLQENGWKFDEDGDMEKDGDYFVSRMYSLLGTRQPQEMVKDFPECIILK